MKAPPFASRIDSGGENRELSKVLELTLVLSLVAKQTGGYGVFRRRQKEQVVYVSQILWPFYFFERDDTRTLVVFDGLGLFEHKFAYSTMPPLEMFEEEVAESKAAESEIADILVLLRRHASTFKELGETKWYPIQGCVTSPGLISDLLDHSESAPSTPATLVYPESAVLSPRVSADAAKSILSSLFHMVNDGNDADIKRLEAMASILSDASVQWVKQIEGQQEEVRTLFNSKIVGAYHDVEKRVESYQEEMHNKLDSIEERSEPLISKHRGEISRLVTEEQQLKGSKSASTKAVEFIIRSREAAQYRLNDVLKEKEKETERVLKSYTHLIDNEWHRIKAMERDRDEKIQELQGARSQVLELSEQIAKQIRMLIQQKQSFAHSAIDRAMIAHPLKMKPSGVSGIYVPLWIALLMSRNGERLVVISPIKVKGSRSISDRVRSMLGQLVLPVKPRTQMLDALVTRKFREHLQKDETLREEVLGKAAKHSVLKDPTLKLVFNEGMLSLLRNGWINTNQAVKIAGAFLR